VTEHTVRFLLNGEPVEIAVRANSTLLDVLRRQLKLISVKKGCARGECGACTVLLDGKAVCSCLVLAPMVNNRTVVTVEGLGTVQSLHPLQEAFIRHTAVQCGFCTSGMLLSAKALLDEHPNPSQEEVRRGIAGNLCRCTGYAPIVAAILDAAKKMRIEP
jgi:carbon-monoxide dehydrogenase small subunit